MIDYVFQVCGPARCWLIWPWLGEGSAASTPHPSQGPAGKPRLITLMAKVELKRASGNTQGLSNPGLTTGTRLLLSHPMDQTSHVAKSRGREVHLARSALWKRAAANLPLIDWFKLRGLIPGVRSLNYLRGRPRIMLLFHCNYPRTKEATNCCSLPSLYESDIWGPHGGSWTHRLTDSVTL